MPLFLMLKLMAPTVTGLSVRHLSGDGAGRSSAHEKKQECPDSRSLHGVACACLRHRSGVAQSWSRGDQAIIANTQFLEIEEVDAVGNEQDGAIREQRVDAAGMARVQDGVEA